jgi:hypothetical protein
MTCREYECELPGVPFLFALRDSGTSETREPLAWLDFVRIESVFYLELGPYLRSRAEEFLRTQRAEGIDPTRPWISDDD